jgi:hypothetical protein
MYDELIVRGSTAWIEEPDWAPLERFLPLALCGLFMAMHSVELEDGRLLGAYKHSITRRYLVLDSAGDAYEDLDRDRYRRMRHADAIEQAFPSSWLLWHAGADEREALREALVAAVERGNGDRAAGAHILPSSPASALRRIR